MREHFLARTADEQPLQEAFSLRAEHNEIDPALRHEFEDLLGGVSFGDDNVGSDERRELLSHKRR